MEDWPHYTTPACKVQARDYASLPIEYGRAIHFLLLRIPQGVPRLGPTHGRITRREHALGNWPKPQTMPEYYSDHNLRMSFIVKWSLVKACRIAASTVKMTKPDKAWNFSWGTDPTYVPDWTVVRAEATAKAADITAKPVVTTSMPLPSLSTADKSIEGLTARSDCSEDSSTSNSSLDDSDDGLAKGSHLRELLLAARITIVAHGKAAKSLVHLVADEDDDSTSLIKLACSSRLNLSFSTKEAAEQLKVGEHMPCKKCCSLWPDYTTGFWD